MLLQYEKQVGDLENAQIVHAFRAGTTGAALGIPTFYVRENSTNLLLVRILQSTKRVRRSHRYAGYLRVELLESRRALVDLIAKEGAGLIEMMGLEGTIADLRRRIDEPGTYSAFGKLTAGIAASQGAKTPFQTNAQEFNLAAEGYYREELRKKHLDEALQFVEEDLRDIDRQAAEYPEVREALGDILENRSPLKLLTQVREELARGDPEEETVRRFIHLMLTVEFVEGRNAGESEQGGT